MARTYHRDSKGRFASSSAHTKTTNLYHGTSRERARSIAKQGFHLGHGAWFTRNRQEARSFGQSVIKVTVSKRTANKNRVGERHVYLPRQSLKRLPVKRSR